MVLYHYIIKRVLVAIPVLWGVSVLVFILVRLGGDPVSALIPPEYRTPDNVRMVEERYRLNEPLYIQYLEWLSRTLRGDLGRSYAAGAPVETMIAVRIWPTLQLAILSIFFALIIAVPAGIYSAVYKDTWIDHFGRAFAFLGVSIPHFWMGIMFILIFSLFWHNWFGYSLIPPGGYSPLREEGILEWARHIVPPAITLGVGYSAITARLIRSSMVEVLSNDYVTTARSKGAHERRVIIQHAFRNGLIPVTTVVGMQIAFLLNGAVIVEVVFRWPGVGRLLYQSVLNQDMAILQPLMLMVALLFILINLTVDITYAFLDPKITYGEEK